MRVNNITSFKGNFYAAPRKEVHMENGEFVYKKSDKYDIVHFSREQTEDKVDILRNIWLKHLFGLEETPGKLYITKDIKGSLSTDVKDTVIVANDKKVDKLSVINADVVGNEKGATTYLITRNAAKK